MRIDGAVDKLANHLERPSRCVGLGHAHGLVDGIVEIETPRGRIPPDIGRPHVRLARPEDDRAVLPIVLFKGCSQSRGLRPHRANGSQRR